MAIDAILVLLNNLYEIFKAIHKTDAEKFEAEWKNDRENFLKALSEGDVNTLNALITKYRNPLL